MLEKCECCGTGLEIIEIPVSVPVVAGGILYERDDTDLVAFCPNSDCLPVTEESIDDIPF